MKRILSILLSAVMLLGMLSALPAVAAENSATGYSQTIAEAGRSDDYKNLPNLNSSDVVDDTTNVLKEEFTSHMAFQVSDYAGLVNLQKLVEAGNSFAGITIYQTANIAPDSETEFSGIGTLLGSSAANYKMRPFSGTYDGQGYTIGNLKLTYGLFYRISGGYCTTEIWNTANGKANTTPVTIKNVVIAKTCTVENTGDKTGAIVSQTVDFKCEEVLDMKVIISNCKSEAASVTGGDMTGGIAGAITQPTVISNCTNASPVTVTGKRGGGVVGRMAATSGYGSRISHTLINCLNTGTVNCTYTSASTGCGGLVGDIGVEVALVSGCVNTGDITATKTSNALGEIVGKGSTSSAQLGLYNNTGRETGALQDISATPTDGDVFRNPSDMKIVGVQTSTPADSKINLRVITAVNDLNTYANIRYKVTVSGAKTNIYVPQDTNAVYSSILASYGTETVNTAHKDVVNNNVEGKECQGLSALVIKDIPTSGTYIFTISVYGLKSGNTTEYWGHTVTVTVVNGEVQQ